LRQYSNISHALNVSSIRLYYVINKGVGRKFSRKGGHRKKTENSKKYRKIALLSLLQWEPTEKKYRKITKKIPKNSTIKPLSTIFVPCMKIQEGGQGTLPLAADAHAY